MKRILSLAMLPEMIEGLNLDTPLVFHFSLPDHLTWPNMEVKVFDSLSYQVQNTKATSNVNNIRWQNF